MASTPRRTVVSDLSPGRDDSGVGQQPGGRIPPTLAVAETSRPTLSVPTNDVLTPAEAVAPNEDSSWSGRTMVGPKPPSRCAPRRRASAGVAARPTRIAVQARRPTTPR